MEKTKELIVKYKELLMYLVFGVSTTVVNFVAFTLFQALLGESLYLISNGLAWFVAVVFAYGTNKLWSLRVSPGSRPCCGVKSLRSWVPSSVFCH